MIHDYYFGIGSAKRMGFVPIILMTLNPAFGQTPSHIHSQNGIAALQAERMEPPGTIDGAKDPDLVPDDAAYKVFFVTLGLQQNPASLTQAHQILRRMKLSQTDTTALIEVLTNFGKRFSNIQSAKEGFKTHFAANRLPEKSITDSLKRLQQQEIDLVPELKKALNEVLSPQGSDEIYSYVNAMKKKMKVYPLPSMPQ